MHERCAKDSCDSSNASEQWANKIKNNHALLFSIHTARGSSRLNCASKADATAAVSACRFAFVLAAPLSFFRPRAGVAAAHIAAQKAMISESET